MPWGWCEARGRRSILLGYSPRRRCNPRRIARPLAAGTPLRGVLPHRVQAIPRSISVGPPPLPGHRRRPSTRTPSSGSRPSAGRGAPSWSTPSRACSRDRSRSRSHARLGRGDRRGQAGSPRSCWRRTRRRDPLAHADRRKIGAEQPLRAWVRYHERIAPYRHGFVVATKHLKYGRGKIEALNARFGTLREVFRPTPAAIATVFEGIEDRNLARQMSEPSSSRLLNPEREARKAAAGRKLRGPDSRRPEARVRPLRPVDRGAIWMSATTAEPTVRPGRRPRDRCLRPMPIASPEPSCWWWPSGAWMSATSSTGR